MARRRRPGVDNSPEREENESRSDSGANTDHISYTNASTISPDRSPLTNDGPVIIRQTNYIVQDSDRSGGDSDTGSGPMPVEKIVEKVKTVERTIETVRPKSPAMPLMEKGSREQLNEVVTETFKTKNRLDQAGLLPLMTERSVSLISNPMSSSSHVSIQTLPVTVNIW